MCKSDVCSLKDVVSVLSPYVGGFMYTENASHETSWSKLYSIDLRKGIFVKAYRLDVRRMHGVPKIWKRSDVSQESIPMKGEGVFLSEESGEFEVYGDCYVRGNGVLVQTYTKESMDKKTRVRDIFINYFYKPYSNEVPEEVINSYYGRIL